ncbi:flagellar biosynthesis protein FliQ [Ammoniphilus sp. CFH 90114]|uniref:flagellar biosynthesis protein FliQ n=1 Tax=Ammoniphilus sp. CFH 90114 TaxID=2493665 RepID=UPI00100EBE61|nr:flagellar biosynthesis protein FliQ [Ammoniphilus sp. CFH 90114]RXT15127.1 flagellar biosynthesis protein FliQ [Ammoniphilus sp. CFH 90114]
MSPEGVINLAKNSVYLILLVTAPVVGIGLLVGLLVAVFQATTQIQEQTLAFVPKIVAILVALIIFGPWMLTQLIDYTYHIFNNLYRYIG